MNTNEACSLQMVIMLKRRAAKAFVQQWVHAIMQWHSQSVGWSGFLDCDCLDASPDANLFQLGLPRTGLLKLLSCPSQTVDKGLGSAIDMSQDMWLACGRCGGWVDCLHPASSKHLAGKLFRVCCIQLGQRIVPNRDCVALKR